MQSYTAIAGCTAGLLNAAAFAPYILSTFGLTIRLRRIETAHPSRVSWLIWTVIGGLIAFSYRKVGATDTAWVTIAMFVGPLIITILAFRKNPERGDLLDRIFDCACLAGAIITIYVWQTTKSPELALKMSICSDAIAALATLRHVVKNPKQESSLAWALFFFGDLLNLTAVPHVNWSFSSFDIWVYPVYMAGQTGLILVILSLKRRLQNTNPPAL